MGGWSRSLAEESGDKRKRRMVGLGVTNEGCVCCPFNATNSARRDVGIESQILTNESDSITLSDKELDVMRSRRRARYANCIARFRKHLNEARMS